MTVVTIDIEKQDASEESFAGISFIKATCNIIAIRNKNNM